MCVYVWVVGGIIRLAFRLIEQISCGPFTDASFVLWIDLMFFFLFSNLHLRCLLFFVCVQIFLCSLVKPPVKYNPSYDIQHCNYYSYLASRFFSALFCLFFFLSLRRFLVFITSFIKIIYSKLQGVIMECIIYYTLIFLIRVQHFQNST